jgi:hypothetical protein
LYAHGAKVMLLYDNGSLGSEVEHFGIGVIIPLFQIFGILPDLKHKSKCIRVISI